MYLSDRYKFIFIHIPKNSGTAFYKNLSHPLKLKNLLFRHAKLTDFSDEDIERYRNYKIVCIVRNPYTRLISHYRYRKLKSINPPTFEMEKYFKHGIWQNSLAQYTYIKHHAFKKQEILKFENINSDIKNFLKKYDIDMHDYPKNEVNNFFGNYDYKDYMTPGFIEWVKIHCQKDFELYGYSKDPKDIEI